MNKLASEVMLLAKIQLKIMMVILKPAGRRIQGVYLFTVT